ncbi:MAG TPA: PKD domain-containing protein, partial [Candidatus Hydrogenedentes bacterium]|nr:PKD domain-containing protein [Candidatus Hydrogenedentota bacterium]
MLRPLKFLALPVALGVLLLMGTGCPPPPSYLPAYIVSTTSLDFGTKDESLKFKVWKNYTSQSLPEFSVLTGGVDWISVSPEFGNSTGPDNKQTITVTIDRSKMDAGVNTADLTISALGVADVKVTVTATASLVADFSAEPVLVNVNQNVQFTDESTVASEAGPIISWLWTFGDGKQSSAQNPKHKYKNPGTYPVTLTVQTATLSDTAVKQNFIVVEDAGAITADFVASDTTPSENTEVDFSDLSVPGNGTINEWFWNFGDGFTSTEQNPTHTYTSIDQFTVSLTVENTSGESDTEIKTNYIDVQP